MRRGKYAVMPFSEPADVRPPPPTSIDVVTMEISVGSMRVTCDSHRLTFVNKTYHRFLIVACILMGVLAVTPLWSVLLTRSGRTHYWVALWRELHSPFAIVAWCLPMILIGTTTWFFYDRVMHRGSLVMDKQAGSVWLGGAMFCLLSELQEVRVRHHTQAIGPSHSVSAVRSNAKPWPEWRARLNYPLEPGEKFIGACRTAAQAGQVAAALGQFACVPVEIKK